MERTKVKFTADYIKGIVDGIISKSDITPSEYNLVVNNYDDMNHVLLQPKSNDAATKIHLNLIQDIRKAIQRIFSEECHTEIRTGGVLLSIIERDAY